MWVCVLHVVLGVDHANEFDMVGVASTDFLRCNGDLYDCRWLLRCPPTHGVNALVASVALMVIYVLRFKLCMVTGKNNHRRIESRDVGVLVDLARRLCHVG